MQDKALFLDEQALSKIQKKLAATGKDAGDLSPEPRVMPPGAKPVVQVAREVTVAEHIVNSTQPSDLTVWS